MWGYNLSVKKNRFLLMLTGGLVFLFASSFAFGDAACAKVAVLIGQAWTAKGSDLKLGQSLEKNTVIQTGENSWIKLVLLDDSVLDLGNSSQLKLTSCQGKGLGTKIQLDLENGSIRALVNKVPQKKREEFKLKTPTSVLGVRGTEFFVTWQQNTQGQALEQIGVVEGKVEVKSLFDGGAQPVSLITGTEFRGEGRVEKSGDEIKVEPKTPPLVDQFTADEQRQAEQNTKVEHQVFEKTIDLSTESRQESEKPEKSQKQEGIEKPEKVDLQGKKEEKTESSQKGDKLASFINTTMESSQGSSTKREIASDPNPTGIIPPTEVKNDKKEKASPEKSESPAPNLGANQGGPTSAGTLPGGAFPGSPSLNNPFPISIPATVKWIVIKPGE